MAWKDLKTVTVSYSAAKRHYIPAKYKITGKVSASGLTDSTYYYLYVEDLQWGDVSARTGRSFTLTYSEDFFILKKVTLVFGPAEKYPDVSASNVSASISSWGSKARATASLSKTSGYVDPANPGTITAKVKTDDSCFEPYTVASGTFYYKLASEETYNSVAFTGTEIDLTGLFTGGNIYNVYVDEVLDDDTAVTSNVYTYSTEDGPAVVEAISPNNVVTYGDVQFRWNYSNTRGTTQYAFDLEISEDGTVWSPLASHVVTSETTLSESIATSGSIYWRVRGYNNDNIVGEWSSASFVNYVRPGAPTDVNISGTGRLTVSWAADNQIAFQVKVGKYDSGWVYSSKRTYFVNEYLPDGEYEIMIRVTNSLGLASEWAVVPYTQALGVTPPVATVTMQEGYNEINAEMGSFSLIYIIRNGVVIAKTDVGTVFDYNCNGEDKYIVRGVMEDDSFADLELLGSYKCRKPALITPRGDIIYVNERLDEEPTISSSVVQDVVAVQYLDREKPTHHVGTMLTRTWSVSCSRDIKVGQVYFYRNFRGDKAWVICSNVQSSLNSLGVHEYQFTLEETDYNEAIRYEV